VIRCIASVQDDQEAPCEGVLKALNHFEDPFVYFLDRILGAGQVPSWADLNASDANAIANISWLVQGRGSLFLARAEVRPSRAKCKGRRAAEVWTLTGRQVVRTEDLESSEEADDSSSGESCSVDLSLTDLVPADGHAPLVGATAGSVPELRCASAHPQDCAGVCGPPPNQPRGVIGG
jgi:hypothetical protein